MRQGFAKNIADIVLVGFEKWSDRKRRMSAELRHELAGRSSVGDGFGGLLLQPVGDGNAIVAIHHEGIMSVVNGSCELHFKNVIERFDGLPGVLAVHVSSCLPSQMSNVTVSVVTCQ